jgi:hypothetical protein
MSAQRAGDAKSRRQRDEQSERCVERAHRPALADGNEALHDAARDEQLRGDPDTADELQQHGGAEVPPARVPRHAPRLEHEARRAPQLPAAVRARRELVEGQCARLHLSEGRRWGREVVLCERLGRDYAEPMSTPAELQPGARVDARGSKYRLEVLRGPEMAPLLPLFHDAFGGRPFSLDWLTRKYACERDGLTGFACVAFDENGDAAGSVGVLPWGVRFGDRAETAGQMVDVASGSAHRGRGLFVLCAEMARQQCEAAGVGFLFGFPNEAAYPIWMKKLGYEHIHDLVVHDLAVRTAWVERAAAKAAPVRRAYERYVGRALARRSGGGDALQNSLLGEGFAGIDRDDAFHGYKTHFTGCRIIDVEGGRAWVGVRHGLLVGDFEALSEAQLVRSVRALRSLARRLGVHHVLFQASADTRFTSLLRPLFRASPGMPVIYRNLSSQIPSDKLRFSFGDFDNF